MRFSINAGSERQISHIFGREDQKYFPATVIELEPRDYTQVKFMYA